MENKDNLSVSMEDYKGSDIYKGFVDDNIEKGKVPQKKEGEPITITHNKTGKKITGHWRTMSGSRVFVSSDGKMEIAPDHVKENVGGEDKSKSTSGSKSKEASANEFHKNNINERISDLKAGKKRVEKLPEDYVETGGSGRNKQQILKDFDKHLKENEGKLKEISTGKDNSNSKSGDSTKEGLEKERKKLVRRNGFITEKTEGGGMKTKLELDKNNKRISEIDSELKGGDKKESKDKEEKESVYIEYLNKDKEFKKDKKIFDSYDDAVKWGKENFEKFHPDMVNYEMKDDGKAGEEKKSDPKESAGKDKPITMDTFKELAKKVKTVKEFMEEARKIKNVPGEVADEFQEKYGANGSSVEQAAKNLMDEVNNSKKEPKSNKTIKEGDVKTDNKIDWSKVDSKLKDEYEEKFDDFEDGMDDIVRTIDWANKDTVKDGRIVQESKEEYNENKKLYDAVAKVFNNDKLKTKEEKLEAYSKIKELSSMLIGETSGHSYYFNEAKKALDSIKEKHPEAFPTENKDQLRMFKSENH